MPSVYLVPISMSLPISFFFSHRTCPGVGSPSLSNHPVTPHSCFSKLILSSLVFANPVTDIDAGSVDTLRLCHRHLCLPHTQLVQDRDQGSIGGGGCILPSRMSRPSSYTPTRRRRSRSPSYSPSRRHDSGYYQPSRRSRLQTPTRVEGITIHPVSAGPGGY